MQRSFFKYLSLLAIAVGIAATSASAAVTVLRVSPTGLTVAQGATGDDWNHAFKYLQDAIEVAGTPGSADNVVQLWVAGGIYRPDQGGTPPSDPRAAFFELHKFVEWYAGFASDGSIDALQDRDIYHNLTFLSGDIGIISNLSDNSHHIVKIGQVIDQAKIDGFVIAGGQSIDEPSTAGIDAGVGSAIVIRGGDQSNFQGSSPWIVRCIIGGNFGIRGGAVYITGGQSTLPKFQCCTFVNNHASDSGGAAYVENYVGTGEGPSLGFNSQPSFTNCVFTRNTANNSGGAVYGDTLTICTFTNCTIASNQAFALGGGALKGGGGVFHEEVNPCGSSGSPTNLLYNCILWQNNCTGCSTDANDQVMGARYLSNSDVQGLAILPGACTTNGSFDQDPQFRNIGIDDLRLRCTSPCIDRVTTAGIPADFEDLNQNDVTTLEVLPDRVLRPRAHDIHASSTDVDLGAYERQNDGCDADINNSGTVDIDDLVLVITSWGACGTLCPADIAPVCDLNALVDIDDLVAVITNWGFHCAGYSGYGGIPTSFQECWDDCSANFAPGSDKWHECMDACILSLCRLGYTQYCP